MFIASSACFVCKVVNNGNKAGVVLFSIVGSKTHRNARKHWFYGKIVGGLVEL